MNKAKEEIGANVGAAAGDAVTAVATSELLAVALSEKKNRLYKLVTKGANLPPRREQYETVSTSVAYRGLQKDYNMACKGNEGVLLIVYEAEGKGKSFALQGVSRFKSENQPHRFLVINIRGSGTCQNLLQQIKDRVIGRSNFSFSPAEVAEVIQYGLCGPTGDESYPGMEKLPATDRACRLDACGNPTIRHSRKKKNFPILVIDEFNPSDFRWEKDYTLHELEQKMGDAFRFFNALTGEANSADGFVAFVGTKSEAVARALHKINGGSKAALARSTTIQPPTVGNPFSDWRGIRWSAEDKEEVIAAVFGEELESLFKKQGLTAVEVENKVRACIADVCSHDDWNIRTCCLEMQGIVDEVDEQTNVIIRMATKDGSPESENWWNRFCCFFR